MLQCFPGAIKGDMDNLACGPCIYFIKNNGERWKMRLVCSAVRLFCVCFAFVLPYVCFAFVLRLFSRTFVLPYVWSPFGLRLVAIWSCFCVLPSKNHTMVK